MQQATILVTSLLAIGMMMAPAAAAHHADDASDVNVQGEYYVTVDDDGITLWEETNGHDGLQTSQTSYPAGEDGCQGDDRERRGTCFAPSDDEVEF